MTERWLPAPRFVGIYEVSDHGRVRRTSTGRLLTPSVTYGYQHVTFSDGVRKAQPRVHVLVCEAFHGPRPSARHQAAHRDGVRSHNTESNIRWATPEENLEDKRQHGTILRGEEVFGAVLTERDIPVLRTLLRQGVPATVIGRAYGVTAEAIRAAGSGKTWAHVTASTEREIAA